MNLYYLIGQKIVKIWMQNFGIGCWIRWARTLPTRCKSTQNNTDVVNLPAGYLYFIWDIEKGNLKRNSKAIEISFYLLLCSDRINVCIVLHIFDWQYNHDNGNIWKLINNTTRTFFTTIIIKSGNNLSKSCNVCFLPMDFH